MLSNSEKTKGHNSRPQSYTDVSGYETYQQSTEGYDEQYEKACEQAWEEYYAQTEAWNQFAAEDPEGYALCIREFQEANGGEE